MAIPCDVALSQYLDFLTIERGLSSNSISSYRRDLIKFSSIIEEKKLSYDALNESDILSITAELKRAQLSVTSINRFQSSLKGFYKYCAQEFGVVNPLVDLKSMKNSRKLPKALSVSEVTELINSTDNPLNPAMLRDRAILEILYGTGARVAEVVNLDINDIVKDNLDGEEINLVKLKGKGSKERLVPIGKYALTAVEDYLVRLRPVYLAKGNGNEKALFLNAQGKRLSRQSAWKAVSNAAEATGLSGRVSPHVFRHSYATHLLDGGADIRVVQELLGHASVTTTQIYTLVTIDKVRESYTLSHPRAK